ncbi:MAG: YlbF family regulator [Phycisphaerae bacterium]|jgi:cell fate (sporulation/competence/biofilm development) regulator YlbF (YheA/YmcA/DUF963 family)
MSDIDDLVNQARALGEAMARNPRIQAYIAAQQAVAADASARGLLGNYQQHAEQLHRLEAAGKPIEPEMKRKLAEFEQSLASNDVLKNLMRRQADYIEVMNRVNQAMEGAMAERMGGQA